MAKMEVELNLTEIVFITKDMTAQGLNCIEFAK